MKKVLPYALLALIVIVALIVFPLYQRVFAPSVRLPKGETYDLYIPKGADYVSVGQTLLRDEVIGNPEGFQWVARQMNYPSQVKPGRYVLEDGMSNRELVQILRTGRQTPVKYTFVKFRSLDDLAAHAAQQFYFSKNELLAVLNNDRILKKYGLTPETTLGIFVPNTYEMWWTTEPDEYVDRMYKEYRRFWNEEREAQREAMNLTRMEVMILASIVEEETNHNPEKPTVAGVYLNRIRKNMLLQADPTVKFAVGDFALRRILNRHLEIESPYNTYLYGGLPPGPISTPSIPSIDAVIANERHDYYYFVAKADGSGQHDFSRTLSEHNRKAALFHQELNRRGVR